jgi:hypothetical protein
MDASTSEAKPEFSFFKSSIARHAGTIALRKSAANIVLLTGIARVHLEQASFPKRLIVVPLLGLSA